jgi:hypothetical protein
MKSERRKKKESLSLKDFKEKEKDQ